VFNCVSKPAKELPSSCVHCKLHLGINFERFKPTQGKSSSLTYQITELSGVGLSGTALEVRSSLGLPK
jgi:hypothetical protein